jgi:CHASE2 domain-containing sensor protein
VSDVPRTAVAPSESNVLRGRIVILGADESDQHLTPFGVMSGAEITGAAIETELERTIYRRLPGVWMLLAKAALALLLAFIYHVFKPPFALLATLGVLGGIVVGAFFAFYYGSLLVDFVPFIVGVWIEQLYDATVKG